MKNFKIFLAGLALSLNFVFAQYPLSKEAKIIEQVSSSEIMVEATGRYKGQGKKR